MGTQDEDLAEIKSTQADHTGTLADITEILADHTQRLRRIEQGVTLLLNHHGIEGSK
jgi:predicted amino acid-binding ACT domain protein